MNVPEQIYEQLRQEHPVYTHSQLAKVLGIGPATLTAYRRAGLIDSRKLGKVILYSFDDLMRFLHETEGIEITNTPDGIMCAAVEIHKQKARRGELS